MQGVPVRLELGPKDMESKSVMLARRDTGVKETVAWEDVTSRVPELLEQIQVGLHPYKMLRRMLSTTSMALRDTMSCYVKIASLPELQSGETRSCKPATYM